MPHRLPPLSEESRLPSALTTATDGPSSAVPGSWRDRIPHWIVRGLAAYSAVFLTLFAVLQIFGSTTSKAHAIFLMAMGLVFLWIVLGGLLMWRFRDRVRAWMLRQPGSGPLKFVLLATALILVEEAITTTMSNLAPEFGSQIGVAYITASTNYLLVIGFASVSVIAPGFIGWGVLLRRYDFTHLEVFLLFGFLGTTAEASLSPSALIAGFWFFVYGLMVYLPTYSLPTHRGAVTPRWYHYPLGYLVPLAFQIPAVVLVTLARGWFHIHLFPT
ncbi:MAG: hypothetical protein L3K14_00530 [Thermoplasmata archaeon]|nr:hypothetical protein [Thermoplasmata archaeon]